MTAKHNSPAARRRSAKLDADRPHFYGAHLSIAGGLRNAIDAAKAAKMSALQVFVKNQRQWKAKPLDAETVRLWNESRDAWGDYPIVAHATYLINLASADEALAKKSAAAFADELGRCAALGIAGYVFHPGSAGEQPRAAGCERVAKQLDAILEQYEGDTTPLLETTAGQGATLGVSFAELVEIIAQMKHAEQVGVCVDSCHVFAAGYDIRSEAGFAALVAEAKETIGLERIRCWHLNDSQHGLGSRKDRHAHIGDGQIGVSGFRNILQCEHFRDLPVILETPKGEDEQGRDLDRVNLQRLRRCAGRW